MTGGALAPPVSRVGWRNLLLLESLQPVVSLAEIDVYRLEGTWESIIDNHIVSRGGRYHPKLAPEKIAGVEGSSGAAW